MLITYDSARAITVTKNSDRRYNVSQYDLKKDFKRTFYEIYGGKPESYIKMKDIEQNSEGTRYCAVYYDDGVFKLRTFGRDQRSA